MKRKNLKRSAILSVLMSFAILGNAWAAGLEEKKWSNAYDFIFKNSSEEQTGKLEFDSRGIALYGEDSSIYIKVGNETDYGNVVTIGSDNINLSKDGNLDLVGGISAGDTISTKVSNQGQGQGTAVAMKLEAETIYSTRTDTVSSIIDTNQITQKLDNQYGHSLFQMNQGTIKLEKSGSKGTYGITIEDQNPGKVLISSQHATNGNSAIVSVSNNSIVDTVKDGTSGTTYTVTTSTDLQGTMFSSSGGTAGYSYTNIQGGNISTDNITLRNAGTLTAGNVKINRNGIVAGNKKITSVADGTVAANSKEAVNGGQLYSLKDDLTTQIEENVTEISAGDANVEVAEDGGKGYKISLNKDLALESATFAGVGGAAGAVINSSGFTADDGTRSISFTTAGISAGGQVIQNVADGTVAADSKEAVNGGQLYSLKADVDTKFEDLNTKIDASVTEISAGDTNVEVTEDGAQGYKIGLNKDLDLESATFSDGSGAAGAVINSSGFTADDGTRSISFTTAGISAGGQTIQNVGDGAIEADSKDAVNGGQIYNLLDDLNTKIEENVTEISAGDANVEVAEDGGRGYKISLNKDLSLESATFADGKGGTNTVVDSQGLTAGDGTKNISFTTESISAGGQKVQNVADGEADTDAVNLGQLNKEVGKEAQAREDADVQLQQRIDDVERGMDGRFDRLGDRIDKVGAGAAALAALHPLDYDPDDKLNFSVGLGSYRGEQAAALGAFYRPNEAVMFSIGGTMGNDDNMVNLGVSFALDGKRGKDKESKAQLEQKVANMSYELAEVKAQLALLLQQNNNKK